jgi:phospholipase A2
MHTISRQSKIFILASLFSHPVMIAYDSIVMRDGADNCTTKVATIRLGSELCEQELEYINNRLPRVKAGLEQMLGMELSEDEVPRIALCSSGGGYRAMIGTLGSFAGMEYIPRSSRGWTDYFNPKKWYMSISQYILEWLGYQQENAVDNTLFAPSPLSLLDSCLYTAVLSGSTWAEAGWMQSRLPIHDYIAHVTNQVKLPIYKDVSLKSIAEQLLKKESFGQDTSIVDIYGSMLAQKLLKNLGAKNPNAIDITDYRNVITAGQMPLPISTAVIGKNVVNYEWVEFTPYEVGSTYLNAFVPAWAFGREFNAGNSVDFAPPQSLGFCMGVWGSAFSVSAEDIYNIMLEPQLQSLSASYLSQQFGSVVGSASHLFAGIYDKLKKQARDEDIMGDELLELRPSASQIYNWAYNVANTQLNTFETLELVDGGLSINIPFPPLLRPERNVNIIIVLDNSTGNLGSELPKAEKYAKSHGLKFPKIDYRSIGKAISVHKDPADIRVPVVIYIPLLANRDFDSEFDPRTASYCGTFNLKYTPEQVAQLSGLTQFTMQQNQDIILETIKEWIEDQRA